MIFRQDDVDNTGIISAIKTDHAAIVLQVNSVEKQPTGPSYWKFNSSLLEDPEYTPKHEPYKRQCSLVASRA